MESQRLRTFGEFWPFYVSQHLHRWCRRLHVAGTGFAFLFLTLAAVLEQPYFLLASVFSGYAFAWVGHFFIEHNKPATFTYPFLSLISDFKMFYLTINGKMDAEFDRLKLKSIPW